MNSSPIGQFSISTSGGGSSNAYYMNSPSGAPFWETVFGTNGAGDYFHHGYGYEGITTNSGDWFTTAIGILPNAQFIGTQPNTWNSEAILFPIRCYIRRAYTPPSGQPLQACSLVGELKYSRYVRIDNLEPEQVITL
jgi:hypothetical protein